MRFFPLPLILLAAASANAAELRVYPPDVAISGPNRTQQLIVVHEENDRVVADLTAKTTFASSNAAVAKVDAAGLVTAVGPGDANITATWQERPVSVKVKVEAAGNWSFRNVF